MYLKLKGWFNSKMYSSTVRSVPLRVYDSHKRQRTNLAGHFGNLGHARTLHDAQYVELTRKNAELERTLARVRSERKLARAEHRRCYDAYTKLKRTIAELTRRHDESGVGKERSDAGQASGESEYRESDFEPMVWVADVRTPSGQATLKLESMIRELAAGKIREIAPPDDMTRYELYNKMGRALDTKIGNGLEKIVTMQGKFHKLPKDNLSGHTYVNTVNNPFNAYGGKYADVANYVHTVECKTSIHSVTKGFLPTLMDGLRRRNEGTFTRKIRGTTGVHPVPKYAAAWVVLFGTEAERDSDAATFKLDTVAFWQSCGLNYFDLETVWKNRFAIVEQEINRYFTS